MTTTLRALGGLAAATALALAGTVPADAAAVYEARCDTWYVGLYESFEMCIYEDWDHAMWGSIRYHNGSSVYRAVEGTMIVQKCKAGAVDCQTITATPISMWIPNGGVSYQPTSKKAGSYGYTYRTCSSGNNGAGGAAWVFACTRTNSYTPL